MDLYCKQAKYCGKWIITEYSVNNDKYAIRFSPCPACSEDFNFPFIGLEKPTWAPSSLGHQPML